jgi:hypothetical protein
MSPAEVDELPDEVWAGMVRHMQKEADAIRAVNAKNKPR